MSEIDTSAEAARHFAAYLSGGPVGPTNAAAAASMIRALVAELDDWKARAEKAEAEVARLRGAVSAAQWALQPFSDCVFNDNGDCTVSDTHRVTAEKFVDAHVAYRRCRAALKGTDQ